MLEAAATLREFPKIAASEAVLNPVGTLVSFGRAGVEMATGIPSGIPFTVGGATLVPTTARIAKAIADPISRIKVGAVLAQTLRTMAAPKKLHIPFEPSTVGQIAREFASATADLLPPTLRPAARLRDLELEAAAYSADQQRRFMVDINLTPEQSTAAAQAVSRGEFKPTPGIDWGRVTARLRTEYVGGRKVQTRIPSDPQLVYEPQVRRAAQSAVRVFDNKRDELISAGVAPEAMNRLRGAYLPLLHLTDTSLELGTHLRPPTTMIAPEMLPPVGRPEVPGAARLKKREMEAGQELPEMAVKRIEPLVAGGVLQEKTLAAHLRFQQDIIRKGFVSETAKPGWVLLEPSRSLHKDLSGKYVPHEVARDFFYYDTLAEEFGNPKFWTKMNMAWKELVTADNPPVWVANIVGNTFILDLLRAGSPMTVPALIVAASREMETGGPAIERAAALGLFGEAPVARQAIHREVSRALAEAVMDMKSAPTAALHAAAYTLKTKPILRALTAAPLREAAGIFYRAQDEVFRWIYYRHLTSGGVPERLAVEEARKAFVNYARTPLSIRRIGTHPLSPAPFRDAVFQ